jgi:hypothetical protein
MDRCRSQLLLLLSFFLVKEIDVQTSNKFGIILKTIYVF